VFPPTALDWTPHVEVSLDPHTGHVIQCLRVVSTMIEEQSKHRKESKDKRRVGVRVPAKEKGRDKTPRHVRAKSTMVSSPRRTREKDVPASRDKPRDKKEDRMSLSLAQLSNTNRDGPKSASTSPRATEPLKLSLGGDSDDSEDLDFDLSLAEDLIGDDDKLESLKKQLQMNFGEDSLGVMAEVREDEDEDDEDSMGSFDLDMEGADDAFFKAFDLEEKETSKLDDDFNSLMSSLSNPGPASGADDDSLPSLPYEVDSIQKALHGLKLLESNDSTSSNTDPKTSAKTDSGVSTPSSLPSTPTTAPSSPFAAPASDVTPLSDIFDRSQVRRVFKSFVGMLPNWIISF
jgi:hypothetical protein